MKKILFILVCIFTIILIYFLKNDNQLFIFEISDGSISNKKVINYLDSKNKLDEYVQYNNNDNYRLINLKNDINSNNKIKQNKDEYAINNLFIKSDYIVLNIGNQDIAYYLQNTDNLFFHLDNFVKEYEEIIKTIREISKEKIIIIFNYELKEKYNDYLFNKMSIISNKYDCKLFNEDKWIQYIKKLY